MRRGSLILTLTRRCNLRCSYCPTVKDGWPSLTRAQVARAFELFAERGGGDVKLFGGEPLLEPELVEEALVCAEKERTVRRLYLSTNGIGLTPALLDRLAAHPKLVLTLSMDGRPDDHRRLRRALPVEGTTDAYAHLVALMPKLRRMRRVVVTQTIAPATAAATFENFSHLRELGWWRFNFLPGYYLPWSDDQLGALEHGFRTIGDAIADGWEHGERLYVRNLFTLAPTPFFNTGLVVDSDGSIHATNVGLSSSLDGLLEATRVGTLERPPTAAELQRAAERVPAMLEREVAPQVLASTQAVDQLLTAFCERLYPHYLRDRQRRRSVA
ncbi:MAG: radical SAM protein [Deltaproteobacteria bacterium]|nr:radical SAM protein [Deltaproteobacteria bacterium]